MRRLSLATSELSGETTPVATPTSGSTANLAVNNYNSINNAIVGVISPQSGAISSSHADSSTTTPSSSSQSADSSSLPSSSATATSTLTRGSRPALTDYNSPSASSATAVASASASASASTPSSSSVAPTSYATSGFAPSMIVPTGSEFLKGVATGVASSTETMLNTAAALPSTITNLTNLALKQT